MKAFNIIVSILYGSVFGLAVYRFILYPIGFPFSWSPYIAKICCVLFTFLCLCSIQVRCISVLMWLEAFGKASRSVIKALVIAFLITGPLNNIVLNAKELTRVVKCTTYLTYNLSKTKFDLAVKPFTNAFANMDREIEDIRTSFQKIQKVVSPILNEIENEGDDVLYQE